MLSVSNSLPVSNYSVKVVSEANGSVFNPQTNSRVRLTLPSSLGMVDMHSSYLQFKLRVVPPVSSQAAAAGDRRDCYNMVMSNDQGAEQIIKNLRVSIDNKPVEEIQNYNVLHKFKKDYSEDNAQKTLDSVFDKSIQKNDGSGYYCRSLVNGTPLATYNQPQKHIVKLGCSGVLSLPVGLPVLATGKVDIEFELEDADRVLACATQHRDLVCDNGVTTGAGIFTSVDITPTDGGTRYDRLGFSSVDINTCPFAVGNTIRVVGNVAGGNNLDFHRLVTAVAIQGGKVRVTFADSPAGGAAGAAITGILLTAVIGRGVNGDNVGALNATQYSYEVSEVEYVVRSIEMPPPYLGSLQKRIQQNSFEMDIPTYTSYIDTIQPAITKQTINVPAFSSRVKSVLSVPLLSAQVPYEFNRNGQLDGIRSFQAQIGTRREPNRAIEMSNTSSTIHRYASQEYLHELKKVLTANGIGLRSLKQHATNFVMCRSLSSMGGSEDLSDKGFRFDVEYNSNPSAKNVFSYVYHLKRLTITPAGLEIMG